MKPGAGRKIHYEDVPSAAGASLTFREFKWARFPFNWHYHPEVELTLIVQGRGLRFVGDSVEEFSDGDLCLVGSNVPHCWASAPDAQPGVRSLVIHFRPAVFGAEFWELPELSRIRAILDRAQFGLALSGPTAWRLRDQVLSLAAQPHGAWRRLSTVLSMIEGFGPADGVRTLASAHSTTSSGRQADARLGRILGYIHEHIGPDMRQQAVARATGMSPQAFSQFFKRSLGKTFIDYVNELRIARACRALLATDQTVTEVAFDAGFNNLSHFHAQFRKLKRMTPTEYRDAARAGVTEQNLSSAEEWRGAMR